MHMHLGEPVSASLMLVAAPVLPWTLQEAMLISYSPYSRPHYCSWIPACDTISRDPRSKGVHEGVHEGVHGRVGAPVGESNIAYIDGIPNTKRLSTVVNCMY
jgi:hypothetical protein